LISLGASKLIEILAENFGKSIVSKKGPNVGISLPTKVLNTVLPDEELTVGQSDKQVVGIMTGKTWTRDILWIPGDAN
jgi:hypothetical protein